MQRSGKPADLIRGWLMFWACHSNQRKPKPYFPPAETLNFWTERENMEQEYKGKSSIWQTTIWGIPYWLWLPITSFIFILIFAFIVYKFLNLTGVMK